MTLPFQTQGIRETPALYTWSTFSLASHSPSSTDHRRSFLNYLLFFFYSSFCYFSISSSCLLFFMCFSSCSFLLFHPSLVPVLSRPPLFFLSLLSFRSFLLLLFFSSPNPVLHSIKPFLLSLQCPDSYRPESERAKWLVLYKFRPIIAQFC